MLSAWLYEAHMKRICVKLFDHPHKVECRPHAFHEFPLRHTGASHCVLDVNEYVLVRFRESVRVTLWRIVLYRAKFWGRRRKEWVLNLVLNNLIIWGIHPTNTYTQTDTPLCNCTRMNYVGVLCADPISRKRGRGGARSRVSFQSS